VNASGETGGNYAQVNGLKMYYEIHGTGFPLVVLHGAFMTIGAMEDLVPALAEARRVVAVELFRLRGGSVFGDLAGLPNARLAVLPGTTHVGLVDRADWLAPMIGEFLDTPS
jgi:hypothetical protein